MWQELLELDYKLECGLRHLWQRTQDTVPQVHEQLKAKWPTARSAIEAVLLLPLWLPFEVYPIAWEQVEQSFASRLHVVPPHAQRLTFCCLLSCLIVHVVLLALTPLSPNIWTLLLCSAHGCVIHQYWMSGLRWCRQTLGIRPVQDIDPDNPFANTIFGNRMER